MERFCDGVFADFGCLAGWRGEGGILVAHPADISQRICREKRQTSGVRTRQGFECYKDRLQNGSSDRQALAPFAKMSCGCHEWIALAEVVESRVVNPDVVMHRPQPGGELYFGDNAKPRDHLTVSFGDGQQQGDFPAPIDSRAHEKLSRVWMESSEGFRQSQIGLHEKDKESCGNQNPH